jgi:homoserine kinase type II
MGIKTVLDETTLAEALRAFGLPPPDRVRPEPKGGVNTGYHLWAGGRRLYLRVGEGKTDADVAFEVDVLRFLGEARYPAPPLELAPDGRAAIPVAGRPALLFHYAAGEELAADAVTPDRCRRVGEQLARLHELAAAFPGGRPNPYGPARVAEWIAALGRDGGGDPEVADAIPLLADELARAAALPGAPRGLVHGDLFRDNVLWIGDRVGAVLDWEMACTETFAYDLGVALCAWSYGRSDFEGKRAAALVAGYRARRRIEPETLAALYPWTRFVALRFAASRIHGYHRAALPPDRLVKKDWRRYRDRLDRLRALGEDGFRALVGIDGRARSA